MKLFAHRVRTRRVPAWLLACAAITGGAALGADNAPALVTARDGVLNLRTGDVDTRALPNLIEGAAFDGAAKHVIRLDGPLDDARAAALDGAGVRRLGYLPLNSFIADLSGTMPARMRALGFVAWAGEYRREWKVDPVLVIGGAAAAPANAAVNVWLFEGERTDAVLALIAATPGASSDGAEMVGGTWRVGAVVPAASVAALADLAGVQFVEAQPEYAARSNTVMRWVVQSNVTSQTPLDAHGIHGVGQVVGVIDGWVSQTHCSFFDPVNPIGPLHRKILAYNTFASYDLHGTHVSCTALGDAGAEADTRGVAWGAKLVFNTWPDMTESSHYTKYLL